MTLYIDITDRNKNNVRFGVIRRPPKQTEEQNITIHNKIKSTLNRKEIIIVGDFNSPKADWSALASDQEETH